MPDIRWLSDDEQRAWRLFLRFQRTLADRLSADLAPFGLGFADYEILALLSEAPDRQLRMTELAQVVVSPRSRLTYQIDQLVQRGFVERIKCDTDRRGYFAHLTDPGWDTVQILAPVHVSGVRRHLFAHLAPDDVTAMTTILGRALDGLQVADTPTALSPA
jgi:DNA-binding MarR family transcriptional regulator